MDKLRKLRIYNEVKSDVNGKYYVRVNRKIESYFQITRTKLPHVVSINVEYFLFQLFIALLIFSSKPLSPGVNAGCPNLLNCSAGQCCSANSGDGGSCGTTGGIYKYHCVAALTTTTATTTTTHAPTTEAEEELMAEQAAAVAAGASVLAAAAAAPPPLPMMAPQGLPQPGSVSAGGGVLPATAFAVS